MQKPPRIDWAAIVNDLIRAGVSLAEIAAALEVSKGAPYRWLDGSEPVYSSAVLLLALHAERLQPRPEIRHGETSAHHSGLPCAVPDALQAAMEGASGREREEAFQSDAGRRHFIRQRRQK